jgi:hypothetical protein
MCRQTHKNKSQINKLDSRTNGEMDKKDKWTNRQANKQKIEKQTNRKMDK